MRGTKDFDHNRKLQPTSHSIFEQLKPRRCSNLIVRNVLRSLSLRQENYGYRSVKQTLETMKEALPGKCDCMGGAMLAAAAMWLNHDTGIRPIFTFVKVAN